MVAQLIIWAYAQGYKITLGQTYRSPDVVKFLVEQGLGIKNTLHAKRLAIDLNLFVNGVYMTDTEAYLPLGEYWESLGGTWGGRFRKPDGNHFSIEHEGVR
jgi:hypothetical protein